MKIDNLYDGSNCDLCGKLIRGPEDIFLSDVFCAGTNEYLGDLFCTAHLDRKEVIENPKDKDSYISFLPIGLLNNTRKRGQYFLKLRNHSVLGRLSCVQPLTRKNTWFISISAKCLNDEHKINFLLQKRNDKSDFYHFEIPSQLLRSFEYQIVRKSGKLIDFHINLNGDTFTSNKFDHIWFNKYLVK